MAVYDTKPIEAYAIAINRRFLGRWRWIRRGARWHLHEDRRLAHMAARLVFRRFPI